MDQQGTLRIAEAILNASSWTFALTSIFGYLYCARVNTIEAWNAWAVTQICICFTAVFTAMFVEKPYVAVAYCVFALVSLIVVPRQDGQPTAGDPMVPQPRQAFAEDSAEFMDHINKRAEELKDK